jgi:hypothetical protein
MDGHMWSRVLGLRVGNSRGEQSRNHFKGGLALAITGGVKGYHRLITMCRSELYNSFTYRYDI